MAGHGPKRPFGLSRKTIQFPTDEEIAKPSQPTQRRVLAQRHSLNMKTLPSTVEDVCYRWKSGKYLLVPGISQFDPYRKSASGQ